MKTEACHHHANVTCQYCEKETPPQRGAVWLCWTGGGSMTKETRDRIKDEYRAKEAMPVQGWECPKCQTIFAPFVTHCSICSPRRNYEVFGPYAEFVEAQFKMTTTVDPPSNS